MKTKTPQTKFVRDLTVGEAFTMTDETVYVVDNKTTMGNMTRVDYHVGNGHALNQFCFAKVNLSTVTVLV